MQGHCAVQLTLLVGPHPGKYVRVGRFSEGWAKASGMSSTVLDWTDPGPWTGLDFWTKLGVTGLDWTLMWSLDYTCTVQAYVYKHVYEHGPFINVYVYVCLQTFVAAPSVFINMAFINMFSLRSFTTVS